MADSPKKLTPSIPERLPGGLPSPDQAGGFSPRMPGQTQNITAATTAETADSIILFSFI